MTRDSRQTSRSRPHRHTPLDSGAASLMRAAILVVADEGLAGLTADGLCARAGASRSEFERHWADPCDVLVDALDERMTLPQLPDTGTLEGDLTAYLQAYMTRCSDPAFFACLVYVMAQGRADQALGGRLLPDYIRRRAGNRGLIERAVARGELPSGTDPDPILDAALGLALAWMGGGRHASPGDIQVAVRDLLTAERLSRETLAQTP